MKPQIWICVVLIIGTLLVWSGWVEAQQSSQKILIHMKTSLAEDDAQICAVPNVAWAFVKAGHQVTILVDASAVTSVTKGFGLFRSLFDSKTTALNRAALPERERRSLSEQMKVSIEEVPTNYGEYFAHLKKLGVEIYGNQTMMLLYEIDPQRVASEVTPVPLDKMIGLFQKADKIIVY